MWDRDRAFFQASLFFFFVLFFNGSTAARGDSREYTEKGVRKVACFQGGQYPSVTEYTLPADFSPSDLNGASVDAKCNYLKRLSAPSRTRLGITTRNLPPGPFAFGVPNDKSIRVCHSDLAKIYADRTKGIDTTALAKALESAGLNLRGATLQTSISGGQIYIDSRPAGVSLSLYEDGSIRIRSTFLNPSTHASRQQLATLWEGLVAKRDKDATEYDSRTSWGRFSDPEIVNSVMRALHNAGIPQTLNSRHVRSVTVNRTSPGNDWEILVNDGDFQVSGRNGGIAGTGVGSGGIFICPAAYNADLGVLAAIGLPRCSGTECAAISDGRRNSGAGHF